jgi:hypothetical protein
MKLTFFAFAFTLGLNSFSQESLLLGEQMSKDVYFTPRVDRVSKVHFYISKYHKKGIYKDSLLVGFEDYDNSGFLISKSNFRGMGSKQTYQKFQYEYRDGLMSSFAFMQTGVAGNFGRQGKFEYNEEGFISMQEHSLANIRYEYYEDGRLKTKSYFYNNKGTEDSKPWVNYYLYDSLNYLKHVDTDPESQLQTSFHNSKGELIKNDYYPGVAYSTYEYDEIGNCTKQVDFELGKKDWDSLVYVFTYNPDNQLATSGNLDKKGRKSLTEEHTYNSKGQLETIYYYRKNKRKQVKKFFYNYPKE